MNIGLTEIILILIIAVCVIRPENSGRFIAGLLKDIRTVKDAYREAYAEAGMMADDLKNFAEGAPGGHDDRGTVQKETNEDIKGGDTCI